jgi:Xaa-Pro aminopeptidase
MELAHLSDVKNIDAIVSYSEYPAKIGECWSDVLITFLEKNNVIGVENKSPFEIAAVLQENNFSISQCDLLDKQRWIKSTTEIELIRSAAKYCEISMSQLKSSCYYGMTELEVLGIGKDLQKKIIRDTEFDYLSSNILVAVWPSRISHQPHGVPVIGDKLNNGSHISLSFLRVNGYAAELERTFFTTKPTQQEKDLFNIMLEVRKKCYAVLREGISGEEVDLVAKNFLEKEGLQKNRMHRSGHGIGLNNHEGPFIAEGDHTILKENMVISIEPGIYVEGIGGFRHSDTVRITKSGYEQLTSWPDDIERLTFTNFNLKHRIKGWIAKKMFKIK